MMFCRLFVLIACLVLVRSNSDAARTAPLSEKLHSASVISAEPSRTQDQTTESHLETSRTILVDGRDFQSELISVDESWNVRFGTTDREFVLGSDEIVAWGINANETGGPVVILNDGSRVVAEIDEIRRDSIVIGSRYWEAVEIPSRHVKGILFQPSRDHLERDAQTLRLLKDASRRDVVMLTNGDRLEGVLVESEAASVGVGETPQRGIAQVSVQVGVQYLNLDRDRIESIQSSNIGSGLSDDAPWNACVGFQDGSIGYCRRISQQREKLEFELACGVVLSTRPTRRRDSPWEIVASLRPNHQRVTYVSELPVAQYQFQPAWDEHWDYELDRSVVGGQLRTREGWYPKGIGMHSAASLAFFLDDRFSRLQGDLALDASTGMRGSVVYRVYTTVNGSDWELSYESPVIRGGDSPLPIDVQVDDVLAVTLSVGFADNGAILDRANWLNLRLIP